MKIYDHYALIRNVERQRCYDLNKMQIPRYKKIIHKKQAINQSETLYDFILT
jgi:hypothetical protein